MRRLFVGLVFVAATCLACSGGGGGGGGGGGATLTTGVYAVGNVGGSGSCTFGAPVSNGDQITVTVNGSTFTIGQLSGTISGQSMSGSLAPTTQSIDDTQGHSCSATTTQDFSGSITGDDAFHMVETYATTVSNPQSWSGCTLTACSSTYHFDAAK